MTETFLGRPILLNQLKTPVARVRCFGMYVHVFATMLHDHMLFDKTGLESQFIGLWFQLIHVICLTIVIYI